jgi:hypothetical protein
MADEELIRPGDHFKFDGEGDVFIADIPRPIRRRIPGGV